MAPHRWLLTQRVRRARWLLESTDEPVDAVAARCGLGTDEQRAHDFTPLVGLAPMEYRRTCRSPNGAAAGAS